MTDTLRLIRAWDRNFKPLGLQFVAWNAGTFTIDAEDPLAVKLWDNRELNYRITVHSTDEMVWWVDRMDRTRDGKLIVTCRPHVDVMRDFTVPDWKMVELWLAAEKRWKSEQSNNLCNRIAAVLKAHIDRQLMNYDTGREECGCGLQGNATHREHVADAVIRELGLKRASRPSDYGHVNYPPGYQYITDWIADE